MLSEVGTGRTSIFKRKYKIPVVLVPGIMGSRIKIDHNGGFFWDPDRKWTRIVLHLPWGTEQKRNLFDPANNIEFPQDLMLGPEPALEKAYLRKRLNLESDVEDHLIDRGWNEVAWGFYGDFLVNLQAHSFQGADCPVYAAGYDWRKSNEESAKKLHDRIEGIVEEENADQVVIVTHSMGGLVARSYVAQFGEDMVRSVVHINQPTYGAPVLYRRLRTGGKTWKWGLILGGPESAPKIAGVMDGVLELLPTSSYRMKRTDQYSGWLSGPDRWIEQPPDDMSSLYQQSTNRLGIIPPDSEFREETKKRINEAVSFQSDIDEVFHSETYWICSSGMSTDVAVRIEPLDNNSWYNVEGLENAESYDLEDRELRIMRYRSEQGDGTVPLDSQLGYEMTGTHDPEGVTLVPDVEHAEACNDDAVQQQVFDWIQTMIRDHAKQRALC